MTCLFLSSACATKIGQTNWSLCSNPGAKPFNLTSANVSAGLSANPVTRMHQHGTIMLMVNAMFWHCFDFYYNS